MIQGARPLASVAVVENGFLVSFFEAVPDRSQDHLNASIAPIAALGEAGLEHVRELVGDAWKDPETVEREVDEHPGVSLIKQGLAGMEQMKKSLQRYVPVARSFFCPDLAAVNARLADAAEKNRVLEDLQLRGLVALGVPAIGVAHPSSFGF